MRHTPGPWHFVDCRHQQNGQIRIFNSKGRIANVVASNDDCVDNARLITAAPELLEVARMAEQVAAMELREGTAPEFGPRDLLEKARSAISKAEGRS